MLWGRKDVRGLTCVRGLDLFGVGGFDLEARFPLSIMFEFWSKNSGVSVLHE